MLTRQLHVISSGQVASLAFLVYDICITFDDEVNIIWCKPKSCWIKWQFLFTRYFALMAQIANRTIEDAITSHSSMVSEAYRNWYMCQVVLGSVLMSAVEIVLMARVYALYKKSLWIALLFILLILAEMVTVVIGIVTNVPGKDFRVSIILLKSPTSYVYYGISAIISQIAILGLTLAKYKTAVQGGWGKVPIMILMVRDGTAAFLILLVVTTMTVVATSMETEYAPIGNSWFLSIVACSGCRLILNMQKLSTQTNIQLTTLPTTILLTTLWNDFEQETRVTQVDDRLRPMSHHDYSCGLIP